MYLRVGDDDFNAIGQFKQSIISKSWANSVNDGIKDFTENCSELWLIIEIIVLLNRTEGRSEPIRLHILEIKIDVENSELPSFLQVGTTRNYYVF